MNTIDIVYLVENNPITKLSKSYNNKLLNKLKSEFTDAQQQLFVASFYCYLNYNQTTDFVVDLDKIWEWLGFQQKYHSKISLEKHFILNKDYKILLPNVREQKNTRGGHNKETILLTIKTFKLFCIKAGTKKAGEIHEYFIKLEEILQQTLHEETDELKLQLEEQKQIFDKSLKNTKERERHNLLLREFGYSGEVVYIIRVKTFENGNYIIKIGESRRGVEARYKEHKSKYEEVVILDCFSVKKSRDFELFLHNHEKIRFNRVTDLSGHENEMELFLIGEKLSYQELSNIIQENIKHYNEYSTADFEKLKSEKELLEQKIITLTSKKSDGISELLEYIKNQEERQKAQEQKIEKLIQINQTIMEKLTNLESNREAKNTTIIGQLKKTIGPRLQKINPESMTLVKVYDYVEEAIKESNNQLKRPSIDKAIRENLIYHGFRWNYVPRDEDPTIINIAPTKNTKKREVGYIAKLNKEKTEILNVYIDRKTAAVENGYESFSALDIPVKKGTITRYHYYMIFDNCDDTLKTNFINNYCNGNKNNLILYRDGVGQYNKNGDLLYEFVCKYDCINTIKMSDKTLAKILDKDIDYNGHFYKKLGSKLKCL